MKKIKYLIIGAGISGLSFAYKKRNDDYLIIEKDSTLGGACRSFYDNGFVWDVAGHFFHFHSAETEKFFLETINSPYVTVRQKSAKVFYGGQYIDAPFQYNIHQLPSEEFLQCLTDLYFAKLKDGPDISFEEYVKQKYGNGIAEKFLIPYNEKLYACKMNELEKDSMGAFLPKLDFEALMKIYTGTKGKTYNDCFYYPVNGTVEFLNALASKLDSQKIHLNESCVKIDCKAKTLYTDKETYEYEYLINTSALTNFASMTGDNAKEKLSYNRVLVLNMGFDKDSLDKSIHWAYYPGDEIFYRIGFYNNIAGTDRLSIYVEIGFNCEEEIDIDSSLRKVMVDLKKARIIDSHKLIASNSYIIDPGYAHITSRSKDYVHHLLPEMEKHNIFMVGRYARWEYSAMDDSIEQAFALSEKI